MTFGRLLVTSFGLGYLRPASGTWGSLPPVILALGLLHAEVGTAWINGALAATVLVFSAACLYWGTAAESHFRRKDPGQVVADEVAGQAIALLGLPWRSGEPDALRWNLALAATAFIAFRVFDIYKPPPARELQRLPAGVGILIDDIVAAIYALIVTQLLIRFAWPLLLG